MRKRELFRPVSAGLLALAVVLSAGVAVSGCGIGKVVTRTKQSFGSDLEMKVTVHPKVNLNSPVAVDVVLLKDKKLISQIEDWGRDAQEWFGSREQFFRDHKKGVYHESWEWVPGQQVEPQTIKIEAGTKVGFIFANYISPGLHREQIDPREHFTLHLREKRFEVATKKSGNRD
jgi:hypothetical protein